MDKSLTIASVVLCLASAALAQTPTPNPTAVTGSETDAMRANDAACLARLNAHQPPIPVRQRAMWAQNCKINGPTP